MKSHIVLSSISLILTTAFMNCAGEEDYRQASNEVLFSLDGSEDGTASLAADPFNLRFTPTQVTLRVECQAGVSKVAFVEKIFSSVSIGAAQSYFMNVNDCVTVLNSQSLKVVGNYKTVNGNVHNNVALVLGTGFVGTSFFESVAGKNRVELSWGTSAITGQIVGKLTEKGIYKTFDAFVFNAGYVGQSVLVSTVAGFCSDVVYSVTGDQLVITFKPGEPASFPVGTFGRVTSSPVTFTNVNNSSTFEMTSGSFANVSGGSYNIGFELLANSGATTVLCSAALAFTLQGTIGSSPTPPTSPMPSP